tara:strand:+ start:1043 stop:2584 length:1542 start_codon:yes stop_codon:yes gene_type:complete
MAIKRYGATKDNIITNGYDYTLSTRGTGSNMGYADSLEVYSIYGQASSSTNGRSQELARTLVEFPISSISTDRDAGTLPASGSVSFYLKLFNVATAFTLPQDFTLTVHAVSRSWVEGTGLDMDEYTDLGNSNWINASASNAWSKVGGDYHTASGDPYYTASFALGYENLEVDVTPMVEQWIDGTRANNGFGIRLTGSEEAFYSSSTGLDNGSLIHNPSGSEDTYYTKRFSARSSQYFFKRPTLEARWDSRIIDDRGDFYYSSSLAPAADNLNTLYYYNYIRGRLVNIPGVATGPILVSIYSASCCSTSVVPAGSKLLLPVGGGVATNLDVNVTGGYVSKGIYSASFALTAAATPLTTIFDVWHSGNVEYFTGSLYPTKFPTYNNAPTFERVTSIKNLKKKYSRSETARFRLFIRDKNWSPTIYVKATANNPTEVLDSASYSIVRTTDGYGAVPYGTGSDYSTYLSHDVSGNYFDFDMSMLEDGYMYEIKLSYYNDSIGSWVEQPSTFKFRVEE